MESKSRKASVAACLFLYMAMILGAGCGDPQSRVFAGQLLWSEGNTREVMSQVRGTAYLLLEDEYARLGYAGPPEEPSRYRRTSLRCRGTGERRTWSCRAMRRRTM